MSLTYVCFAYPYTMYDAGTSPELGNKINAILQHFAGGMQYKFVHLLQMQFRTTNCWPQSPASQPLLIATCRLVVYFLDTGTLSKAHAD